MLNGLIPKPKFIINEMCVIDNELFIIKDRRWRYKICEWIYYVHLYIDTQEKRFKFHKYSCYDRTYQSFKFSENKIEKLSDEKKLELL